MAETVLVTGCSGFLGGCVASWVLRTGRQLIACVTKHEPQRWRHAKEVASIRLPDQSMEELLAETKPDCIVHCAGSGCVAESFRDPEKAYLSSVSATRCLFEAVAKHSRESSIVFLSSAAVYGQPAVLPINELTPTNPLSPYGEHKLACELLASQYRDLYGMRISCLRVFSAYGPGLAKQVLWDIYQKAQLGRSVLLHGHGTETRDFVYVDDVIEWIGMFVSDSSLVEAMPVINIASGTSVSIRKLAELLLKNLGLKRDLRFSGLSSLNTPKQWSVDSSLLRSLTQEMPRTVETGVTHYARWLNSLERDANASSSVAIAG